MDMTEVPEFEYPYDFSRILKEFLVQSNAIEAIERKLIYSEFSASHRFLISKTITIKALCDLVDVYQPGAKLRTRKGMNVRVGLYTPPPGGREIPTQLRAILMMANRGSHSSYEVHQRYEKLHPFMDGNGRSGRLLWLWMEMRYGAGLEGLPPLGFLHRWYYDSLKVRTSFAMD